MKRYTVFYYVVQVLSLEIWGFSGKNIWIIWNLGYG